MTNPAPENPIPTSPANDQRALFTLCLMAAFADGAKSELERAELSRIANGFADAEFQAAPLYQDVLLKRVSLGDAASTLRSPELRNLAYEMAVCVCDADDTLNTAEENFLRELRAVLRIDARDAGRVEEAAGALATATLPGASSVNPPALSAAVEDTDGMVLNYAILNAALELLPDSLATMAIVPLQMKMVYRIGQSHGHELGRGHIQELLAAAGIGLTSQVVEGYARKLVSGLLGKIGGGIGKSVGMQVAGPAMTFATTWALGRVAQQYYAGGRRLSAIELRDLFGTLTRQARELHPRYAAAIQEKASTLNVSRVLAFLRGQ